MIVTWGPYPYRHQQTILHVARRYLALTVLAPRRDVLEAWRLKPEAYASSLISWPEFEAYSQAAPQEIAFRAGTPDLSMTGRFVHGLPADDGDRAEMLFQVLGKMTFDLDGPLGHDEWVDYSIFDFLCTTEGTPQLIVSRFAATAGLKAGFSARLRSLFPHAANSYATVCLPFVVDDFRDVELIGVPWGRYKPLGFRPDEERVAHPPGAKLAYGMYEAVPATEGALSVRAGDSIDVPLCLRWKANIDYSRAAGTPVHHATRLRAEASAGYLPRRLVSFDDQGTGTLRVAALGLTAGDEIKIKLNATHFTGVGTFAVRVV